MMNGFCNQLSSISIVVTDRCEDREAVVAHSLCVDGFVTKHIQHG
jgi:hypothetical protein